MINMEKRKGAWRFIIKIVVILIALSFAMALVVSLFLTDGMPVGGNAAVIPINGVILSQDGGIFDDVASSKEIVKLIEKADKNPSIKAIVLDINSPGGTAVASDDIANAVKKTNKTTVALIGEVGASGAYWVASAADYIIANRMSITGSIGVISSYLEFAGLIEEYNVTYQRLVSGEYKDLGNPFKRLTLKERSLIQTKLDIIHDYFIEEVAENRNLSKEKVKEISTGIFYLGSEAKELGLVDELGGKDEAKTYLEKKLNITIEFVEYKRQRTLFDVLKQVFNENSFFIGKGIGSGILKENKLEIIT